MPIIISLSAALGAFRRLAVEAAIVLIISTLATFIALMRSLCPGRSENPDGNCGYDPKYKQGWETVPSGASCAVHGVNYQ